MRPVGLEPTTPWLKVRCIYLLSYERRTFVTFVTFTIFCIHNTNYFIVNFAGPAGIEPTSTVLETVILPLNYGPVLLRRGQDSNLQPSIAGHLISSQAVYHSRTSPSLAAIRDLQPRSDCHLKLQWCRLFTLRGRSCLPERFSTFPIGSVCDRGGIRTPESEVLQTWPLNHSGTRSFKSNSSKFASNRDCCIIWHLTITNTVHRAEGDSMRTPMTAYWEEASHYFCPVLTPNPTRWPVLVCCLERWTGLEPATLTLAMLLSTNWYTTACSDP